MIQRIVLLNKISKSPHPPFTKGGLGRIKGLTLVEVLIAMVILLLVSLALMQTALVSIDANMINVLRDEAVSIAEQRMNELRNISFDDAILNSTGGIFVTEAGISRTLRNAPILFTPLRRITDLNADNKQIEITIRWEWKDKTVANNNPYTHTISTMVRRQ